MLTIPPHARATMHLAFLVLAASATGCGGGDSKQLPGQWAELKIPFADDAEIQLRPNDHSESWHISYPGMTSFYGLCMEYRTALEPLGFAVVAEVAYPIGARGFLVTKDDRVWELSCQRFESGNSAVHMSPAGTRAELPALLERYKDWLVPPQDAPV